MNDILKRKEYIKVMSVDKGLSPNKKYYIETDAGEKLFLRISEISEYDRKKAIYEAMEKIAAIGVPMNRPVEFGVCDDGKSVYSLTTWCGAQALEAIISDFPETEQYALGVEAGRILRKIHSVPAPEGLDDWHTRYFGTIDERLEAYKHCGHSFEGGEAILGYIENYGHLLKSRPQSCLHGDYHMGNLMLDEDGSISVIDWDVADFYSYGDPWLDFFQLPATKSPHFATGQVNGYFDGEVPVEFWRLSALYIAQGALSAIPWSLQFGQEMTDEILELCRNVMYWYDGMRSPMPRWYLAGYR